MPEKNSYVKEIEIDPDQVPEHDKPEYSGSLRPQLDADGDPVTRPSENPKENLPPEEDQDPL